jgi:hypothetical protein
MDLIDAARCWREQNQYVGRGGVVVLYEGKVQGWVNMLRNPGNWRPGCIAVDEDGQCWTARASNDRDGALIWISIRSIAG